MHVAVEIQKTLNIIKLPRSYSAVHIIAKFRVSECIRMILAFYSLIVIINCYKVA